MSTAWASIDTPVGELVLIGEGETLNKLLFTGDDRFDPGALDHTPDGFVAARAQLAEYFAGDRDAFDLSLQPSGTEFQRAVWQALAEIPYGETRSYGQIAQQIGRPKAARAVGMANNRNPIAVIVPCHRVIGANGTMVGYAGGLDRKTWLLDHERARSTNSSS